MYPQVFCLAFSRLLLAITGLTLEAIEPQSVGKDLHLEWTQDQNIQVPHVTSKVKIQDLNKRKSSMGTFQSHREKAYTPNFSPYHFSSFYFQAVNNMSKFIQSQIQLSLTLGIVTHSSQQMCAWKKSSSVPFVQFLNYPSLWY